MKSHSRALAVAACLGLGVCLTMPAWAQRAATGDKLPFPPVPSASVAAPRLQDSTHRRRVEPQRLDRDAPNILIVLLDDVGFGQAATFGGEIATPALSRLAAEGISYNAFHTTAICSPTRAALLTGRNHQWVGSGTIAERAVRTSAFGKWHDTPAIETTAA